MSYRSSLVYLEKGVHLVIAAILIAGLVLSVKPVQRVQAAQAAKPQRTLTIEAWVDGRSWLILRKNTLQWYQLEFAAPGRLEFADLPTLVNGEEWYPVWPDVPDAENRDCYCYSSVLKGVKPFLHRNKLPVEINVLESRGPVSIVEYPSAENDYAMIIEFDDNGPGGAANYKIEIVFPDTGKGTDNAGSQQAITVRALIDGRSQLILKKNTVQWFHMDFAVPGRWGDLNEPTLLNGEQWWPAWPDIPDIYNYNCYCYSDIFKGIKSGPHLNNTTVQLNILEARGPVFIAEYPSADNDYALVIEFNDDDFDAAAWYGIELAFSKP